jgi:hypothetical protein
MIPKFVVPQGKRCTERPRNQFLPLVVKDSPRVRPSRMAGNSFTRRDHRVYNGYSLAVTPSNYGPKSRFLSLINLAQDDGPGTVARLSDCGARLLSPCTDPKPIGIGSEDLTSVEGKRN